MFKKKAIALWRDKRPLKTRLPLTIIAALALPLYFIILGMLDLFVSNYQELPFSFSDLAGRALLTGGIVFAVIFGILLFLRGRLFDHVVSLITGVLVAGFVQAMFFNRQLGVLTGDAVAWNEHLRSTVLNTAVWLTIIPLPMVLHYFSRKIWRFTVPFLCVLIMGMQLATLGAGLIITDAGKTKNGGQFLSTTGRFEVGKEENIIVFIIDRLDEKYVRRVMEDSPEFFDGLDGFTYYPNHTALYCRTFPSVPYMLTGFVHKYETPGAEFFDKAYAEGNLLPALRADGFDTKLYVNSHYVYSTNSPGQLEGSTSNLTKAELKVDRTPIFKLMTHFTGYRYGPDALKPYFWFNYSGFEDFVETIEDTPRHKADDAGFFAALTKEGLSESAHDKNFAFYHLWGSHAPFVLRGDGVKVEAGQQTDVYQQTQGCFSIIYEYMQYLRDMGLYENATIIITGDHGKSDDIRPLDNPKAVSFFLKRSGEAGVEMKTSLAPVSHENFMPTIMAAAGLEYEGTPYYDVPEDADIERRFYYRVSVRGENGYLEEFAIRGDARDWDSWTKVGQEDVKYPYG